MSADTFPSPTPHYDALSPKRRAFLDAYVSNGFNATEAHRSAGYGNDETTDESRRASASRMLTDVNGGAQGRKALLEKLDAASMAAEEVLYRLSQQGQNPQMAFLRADGSIDLEGLIGAGLAHLVKGTKRDKQGRLVVEFYDAQGALKELARVRGLTGPKGTEDDPVHVKALTWFDPGPTGGDHQRDGAG